MTAELIAIRCTGVSKSFDLADVGGVWRVILGRGPGAGTQFRALREISLEVPKGEFVGVLGRNGAGKSTLLRTVGGIYEPDQGSVEIAGVVSGLYELGMASSPDITGREYARRFLALNGATGGELRRLVNEVQEFSELDERFDDGVLTYSSGMAARLFFAVASARAYDVYLIDEILAVGDHHFQAKCWARIRDRVAAGASGLLVTHDWSAVVRLCRTAHILDHGCLVFTGPSDAAVRKYLADSATMVQDRAGAQFEETKLPRSVQWCSGEKAHLTIPVRIIRPHPVSLRLSIERLSIGTGWEIMFMSRDAHAIGSDPGFYSVDLAIPALPLVPGSYILNLFLTVEPSQQEPTRRVLDSRSWLNGEGVEVRVSGRTSEGQVRLPVDWEFLAA
ncbi:MAG TPA: ABC transporter ATP-binding protein [Stellaceae bacterium]|nr:ABC transporter ATP-binding protein [Stellaceae bacterium]